MEIRLGRTGENREMKEEDGEEEEDGRIRVKEDVAKDQDEKQKPADSF